MLFLLGFCLGVGVTLMGLLMIAGLCDRRIGAIDRPEPAPRICDLASLDPY